MLPPRDKCNQTGRLPQGPALRPPPSIPLSSLIPCHHVLRAVSGPEHRQGCQIATGSSRIFFANRYWPTSRMPAGPVNVVRFQICTWWWWRAEGRATSSMPSKRRSTLYMAVGFTISWLTPPRKRAAGIHLRVGSVCAARTEEVRLSPECRRS